MSGEPLAAGDERLDERADRDALRIDALRVEALADEAARHAAALEDGLRLCADSVSRALEAARAAPRALAESEERARRIEELARTVGKGALRADLLGLNVEVAAARLSEDEQGLEKVAHEVRLLADQAGRAAAETEELARALEQETGAGRAEWRRGAGELDEAREAMVRAVAGAAEAGVALAEAREAAAELAAAATVAHQRRGAWDQDDVDAAARLAASAEVRGSATERLGRVVAARLARTSSDLLAEAAAAEAIGGGLEGLQARLAGAAALAAGVDEVAGRAKQLAVNADVAASRAEDPALALFAEEARRLSEQAEGLAGHASTLQDRGEDALAAATGALQAHAARVRRLADDMATVLARFVGAPDAAEALGLAAAWRADRVAARRLAEARALWRQRHGDS